MPAIHPYLLYKNNCKEAFDHYRKVFGGEFEAVIRFKDMPMSDAPMPDDVAERIMHIALPLNENYMLMGSDSPDNFAHKLKPGNNVSISYTADSKEEADRIHQGLSEGGEVKEPMADAPWGDYFGMLTDRFGIDWMVSFGQQNKDTK